MFDPGIKLLHHGDRVQEWLETGKTFPILVEVAPTGYCNANCPWCFFKDKKTTERIDTKVMLNAIEDMARSGVKAINWTGGGEPTLLPDFNLFVEKADQFCLKQGLFTNAYNRIVCQDVFSWIRISLTDKGFDAINKPKHFGICLNQTEDMDENMLQNICLEAKRFGASYFQVRPALVGNYLEQPLLKIPTYLSVYNTKDFKVYTTDYKYKEATQQKQYDFCYGYHFCPSIDWNGKLNVCLYMNDDDNYKLGNLNKESFLDIVFKEKVNVVDKCQNCCKNHEINRILDKAKKIEMVDFL